MTHDAARSESRAHDSVDAPASRASDEGTELLAYYAAIAAYLRRRVHCPHTAADLSQETYLRVARHYGARGIPKHPVGWLYRIAMHVLQEHSRRRLFEACEEADLEQLLLTRDVGSDSAGSCTPPIDPQVVRESIDALSRPDQMALDGFYSERLTTSELAQLLGIRRQLVKTRLHRARRRLRRRLVRAMQRRQGGS